MRPLQHHPDPTTLLAYATGASPTAFAVVIAAHLECCPDCRAAVRDAERTGARLVEQQVGAALSQGARDALRARLGATPMLPRAPRRDVAPARDPDLLPASLRPFFGTRYSALRWRRVVPGVHYLRAEPTGDSGSLMLLRTAPGRSIPMHSHTGHEVTMILRGAYDDVLGRFGAGDVADLDEDVEHQPITAPGAPCICVAATEAPMRFHGWMARALQSVLRL